jgi:hypothetical protein
MGLSVPVWTFSTITELKTTVVSIGFLYHVSCVADAQPQYWPT